MEIFIELKLNAKVFIEVVQSYRFRKGFFCQIFEGFTSVFHLGFLELLLLKQFRLSVIAFCIML